MPVDNYITFWRELQINFNSFKLIQLTLNESNQINSKKNYLKFLKILLIIKIKFRIF